MSQAGNVSGPPQGFAVPLHQAAALAGPVLPAMAQPHLFAPQAGAVPPAGSSAGPRLGPQPPRLTLGPGIVAGPSFGSLSIPSPALGGFPGPQQPFGGANGIAQRSPIRKPVQAMPQSKTIRKQCNCKNSRCLKLYCECFASGRYCDNCNCVNCFNNRESEHVRQSAVEAILERNPNAFRPKIQPNETLDAAVTARTVDGAGVRHTKGCNCKKSFCLKKYCECFQAGIYCSDMCKCIDCKNFDGSDARTQVLCTQDLIAGHQHSTGIKRQRVMLAPSPVPLQPLPQQPPLHQPAQAPPLPPLAQLANGPLGQQVQLSAPQQLQLQQMQALSALQAAQGAQPPLLATTPAPRNAKLDVVNEVVKQGVIEELCRLLILVADEEADRWKRGEQGKQQQQQQQQPPGSRQEEPLQEPQHMQRADGMANGRASSGGEGGTGNGAADGTAGGAGRAAGVSDAAAGLAGGLPGDADAAYAAQERVVLQEFNAILQKIIANTEKKAASSAGKDAAAAAAPPAATAAPASAPAAHASSSSSAPAAGVNARVSPTFAPLPPPGTQQQLQQILASAAAAGGLPPLSLPLPVPLANAPPYSQQAPHLLALSSQQQLAQLPISQPPMLQQLAYNLPAPGPLTGGFLRLGPALVSAPGQQLLPGQLLPGLGPAATLAPIAPLAMGLQPGSEQLPGILGSAGLEGEQAGAMQAAATALLNGMGVGAGAPGAPMSNADIAMSMHLAAEAAKL